MENYISLYQLRIIYKNNDRIVVELNDIHQSLRCLFKLQNSNEDYIFYEMVDLENDSIICEWRKS
jgi:hypothetical protein